MIAGEGRMKKTLDLGVIGLLAGLGVLLWQWPYLWLPGEIAMHRDAAGSRAVYLFTPGRLLGDRWQRITPPEVFALDSAWSPDGQYIAFRCSDGIVKGGEVDRPGKLVSEQFVAGETIVKRGLCLVDRNGDHFRWLVTDIAPAEITWTLDGRYIVFRYGILRWYRVDLQNGGMTLWNEETEVQDRLYWYEDMPTIPEKVIQWAKMPFCFASMNHGKGTPSPGGRYIAFIAACGESDPLWLYAYDTKAKRLLRLIRTRDFTFYDLVWLPDS
jgi:dipeptidyl aminopeptidase/acylaminoacyl peptidase